MRLRPSRIHLFRIPSLSASLEPSAVSFLTIHYSGTRLTWRESLQISKRITTIIAPIAHSAATRQLNFLETHPNISLDVFNQMANVYRAVGIGQGAGNKNFALLGFVCTRCGHYYAAVCSSYIERRDYSVIMCCGANT